MKSNIRRVPPFWSVELRVERSIITGYCYDETSQQREVISLHNINSTLARMRVGNCLQYIVFVDQGAVPKITFRYDPQVGHVSASQVSNKAA